MKLIFSILVLVAIARAEYGPSGFRPQGPAFELPQRGQQPNYAIEPRNPTITSSYGEPDVSVQGLPTQEQLPLFQLSPISGRQYLGPSFDGDLKNLEGNFRDSQYQLQQEKQREFDRQRQLNAQASQASSPNSQIPRQFTAAPSATFSPKPEFKTPKPETTTEASLNEGEIQKKDDDKKEKVSVEVSKQNIQEFPPELLINPLTQLRYQQQFGPVQQIGQLRAPIYFQPQISERQVAQGYDGETHFAALSSILAQSRQAQLNQNQPIVIARVQEQANPAYVIPQAQVQQQFIPQPQQIPQQPQRVAIQPQQVAYQPQQVAFQPQQSAYQPQQVAYQPQQVAYQPQQVAYQPQQVAYQPQQVALQPGQIPQTFALTPQTVPRTEYGQPNQSEEKSDGTQPQVIYQSYQPQDIYQVPANQDPNFAVQSQLNYPTQDLQYYQSQLLQQQFRQNQQLAQGQDGFLQSGLDLNQQGNNIDQPDEENDDNEDGNTATAVATAFGTRTQPRMFTKYGAPVPIPRSQLNPAFQTTTESAQDETREPEQNVAEATSVARGGRRKSAKLRSRRVRPVFTLDRSGHLVLAQEQ